MNNFISAFLKNLFNLEKAIEIRQKFVGPDQFSCFDVY